MELIEINPGRSPKRMMDSGPSQATPMESPRRATRAQLVLAGILVGALATYALVMILFQGAPEQLPAVTKKILRPAPGQMTPGYAAQAVQRGGVIVYFRHGQRQKWDSVIAFDVYELATGVDSAASSFRDAICLTPQGTEEAKMIGQIFALAKVKVGPVVASPSCRAQQTARLAFGRIDQTSSGLAHTPVTNANDATAFRDELARVLRTVPLEPGRTVAIVAHANTLENHSDLFAQGADLLQGPIPMETGFYVIRRDAAGKLQMLYKFMNLGEFAAAAITLDPTRLPPAVAH